MPVREERIVSAIILLAALLIGLLFSRSREAPVSAPPSPSPAVVEIKGAVPKPGIYTLDSGKTTVSEALEKAGWSGILPVGTGARKLTTGESLELTHGEKGHEMRFGRMPAAALLACGQKLDLNSASADELLLIPKIRRDSAEQIVRRREKKRWEDLSELEEIQGLGPKTILRLREYLAVYPPGAQ